jgi:formyltetrahydrofolate-dependent phosphoribosylglycinamide formyltransferase
VAPAGAAGGAPARVAVLASGGGSNLQALLDHAERDPAAGGAYRVVLAASDRAGSGALTRAAARGVATAHLPDPRDGAALLALLGEHAADLVVLAGYLKLVPAEATRAYAGRMVNVHPALLPAFGGAGMYGRRVHEAVLASGACVSGPTVHFVDEAYDRGPIIAQWPVPVFDWDTPESLAARVLRAEHVLLPRVVGGLATGRMRTRAGEAPRVAAEPVPGAESFTFLLGDDEAALAAQVDLVVGPPR